MSMKTAVRANLDSLAEAGFEKISLGLKPSGTLHLGNAITFVQAVLSMQNNPASTLDVQVMDLDFDLQRGHGHGGDYVAFYNKRDWMGCHDLVKYHTQEHTAEAFGEIADYLGIERSRINVSQFSDMTGDSRFQDMLSYLFGTQSGTELLRRSLLSKGARPESMLSPICDDCSHSSTRRPNLQVTEKGIELQTACYNTACAVDEYSVLLKDHASTNLFYLVDPIRDLVPDANGKTTDVHLFGGDYAAPYGTSKKIKADRVAELMGGLSDNVPTVYIGPIVVFDGEKIGKSREPIYTLPWMKETYPNWVERMHAMLTENPTSTHLELAALGSYFA